jgi:hypothetical protein
MAQIQPIANACVNGKVAPIPAVRGTPIEPQGSTALTVIRPNAQLLAVIRRAGAQLHPARLANARSPNVIGRPLSEHFTAMRQDP